MAQIINGWQLLTRNALCTGCMSKHHLPICITNAVHVRNLACKIRANYDYDGKNKRLAKINSICYIPVFHLHQSLSRAHQQEWNHVVWPHWSTNKFKKRYQNYLIYNKRWSKINQYLRRHTFSNPRPLVNGALPVAINAASTCWKQKKGSTCQDSISNATNAFKRENAIYFCNVDGVEDLTLVSHLPLIIPRGQSLWVLGKTIQSHLSIISSPVKTVAKNISYL